MPGIGARAMPATARSVGDIPRSFAGHSLVREGSLTSLRTHGVPLMSRAPAACRVGTSGYQYDALQILAHEETNAGPGLLALLAVAAVGRGPRAQRIQTPHAEPTVRLYHAPGLRDRRCRLRDELQHREHDRTAETGGREAVRECSRPGSACVDVLHAPASSGQLDMISPAPDTGPTWPNGRLLHPMLFATTCLPPFRLQAA